MSVSGIKAGKAFVLVEAVDKTAHVLRNISKNFQRFGDKMVTMGRNILLRTTAALTPAAISLNIFRGFDDAMRRVEARSQGTASELGELRKQVRELGRTTPLTATAVGELQAKLAQKGYNRGELKAMTGDIVNLAIAAGDGVDAVSDTVNSADLVSGAIKQFGLQASDTGMLVDLFTAAINNSNFDLVAMIDALKQAGPTAEQYGLSIQDTVSLLAVFRDANLDASTATTAMRNMFLELSEVSKRDTFNKSLKEMTGRTIDFVNEAGDLRSLPTLLFEIGESVKGLGTSQKGSLLMGLFGKRSVVPSMIAGEGSEGFGKVREAINTSTGLADKTRAIMEAGIGGTIRSTISALEGMAISIGMSLAPAIIQLGTVIIPLFQQFAGWVDANQDIVVSIVSLVAGLALAGAGMLTFGITLKIIAFAFSGLATIITVTKLALGGLISLMTLFGSPIAIVIGLLAIGGAAFLSFTETGQSALASLTNSFFSLLSNVRMVMESIGKAISAGRLDLAFALVWAGIKQVWQTGINWLMGIWDATSNTLMGGVNVFRFGFLRVMSAIWTGVQTLWEEGAHALISILTEVFNFGERFANDYINFIRDIIPESLANKLFGKARSDSGIVSEQDQGKADREKAHHDRMNEIGKASLEFEKSLNEQEAGTESARKKGMQESAKARQAQMDAVNAEMQSIMAEIDAAAADAAATAEEATKDPTKMAKADEMAGDGDGGISSKVAASSPGALRGLEKGSIEAAEQAAKNRNQDKLLQTVIDKQDELIAATEGVEDAIRDDEGMEGV